jgi:hypothetical protein
MMHVGIRSKSILERLKSLPKMDVMFYEKPSRYFDLNKCTTPTITKCCMSSLVDAPSQHLYQYDHHLPLMDSYRIDKNSETYKSAIQSSRAQVKQLRNRLHLVHQGGGIAAVKRHQARNKMIARDRIDTLVDPGSPFLELSPLAGMHYYPDEDAKEDDEEMNVPSGSIVTGIGIIAGVPTMIVANDSTVKGGTYHAISEYFASIYSI